MGRHLRGWNEGVSQAERGTISETGSGIQIDRSFEVRINGEEDV
jgi:hypothetical protein